MSDNIHRVTIILNQLPSAVKSIKGVMLFTGFYGIFQSIINGTFINL